MEPESDSIITGVVDQRKGRLLVDVSEDIISTHVSELRKGLMEILESSGSTSWKALYLDIRNARMVDSMGMNWLFAESVRLKEMNKTFVVRISSPAINRVMQFAGLDKMVTLKYRRRRQTR